VIRGPLCPRDPWGDLGVQDHARQSRLQAPEQDEHRYDRMERQAHDPYQQRLHAHRSQQRALDAELVPYLDTLRSCPGPDQQCHRSV
jgi:hypothetical protein